MKIRLAIQYKRYSIYKSTY